MRDDSAEVLFQSCLQEALVSSSGMVRIVYSLMLSILHFLLGARDRRLGAEHYQLPCGFTGTSSGSCKETEVARFGHVTRHDSLSETIFQGTLEGGRRRGRQRKCWMDNSKEWTSLPMPELLTRASCRKGWKRNSAESSPLSPRRPNRSGD